MSTTDKDGRIITIGDRVITDGLSPAIFTIEVIRDEDGWVWGSDVPKPYISSRWYEDDGDFKNYRNPRYLSLYKKNSDTHRGNILKFNFK